jgi:hypothetical protein
MPPLYAASVPVLLHYLDRIEGLLDRAQGRDDLLSARLAPDMFNAGVQIATALGFALRGTYPLAGLPVPAVPEEKPDDAGLRLRLAATRAHLRALEPEQFEDAATRLVRHRAGFAELEQRGDNYLTLFAMPNFLFHLSMTFAILRNAGLEIGKADFDGLHDYPHGFRF